MNREPRSLAASIVLFAGAVLAAAWALRQAVRWLEDALPVLVPTLVIVGVGIFVWRRYRQSDRW
jgi:hypothetical protein